MIIKSEKLGDPVRLLAIRDLGLQIEHYSELLPRLVVEQSVRIIQNLSVSLLFFFLDPLCLLNSLQPLFLLFIYSIFPFLALSEL